MDSMNIVLRMFESTPYTSIVLKLHFLSVRQFLFIFIFFRILLIIYTRRRFCKNRCVFECPYTRENPFHNYNLRFLSTICKCIQYNICPFLNLDTGLKAFLNYAWRKVLDHRGRELCIVTILDSLVVSFHPCYFKANCEEIISIFLYMFCSLLGCCGFLVHSCSEVYDLENVFQFHIFFSKFH